MKPKRLISLMLCALLLCALLPASAHADGFVVGTYARDEDDETAFTSIMPASNVKDTVTPVSYVDENGYVQSCANYTLLTGSTAPATLAGGWYVAKGTIDYFTGVTFIGDVNLILTDGCVLTAWNGEGDNCVNVKGNDPYGANLTVYGQTDQTGTLTVSGKTGIRANAFTVYGGRITTAESCEENAIIANTATIVRGIVTVAARSNCVYGNNVTITGGNVSATGGIIGISSITLGLTDPTDSIFSGSYWVRDGGTFSVQSGKRLRGDNGVVYAGTITDKIDELAGVTLVPVYNIYIADSEHGSITADKEYADAGDSVTLTITPDEGYILTSLRVKDAKNFDVTVTDNVFTMPACSVTVKAKFNDKIDTIEIGTYEELLAFAARVNGGETSLDAVLTADIVATDTSWTPIGNINMKYLGTFDGQGHTIEGLSASIDDSYTAMFRAVGADGRMQNLALIDAAIYGSYYTGGIAGNNGGVVQDCCVIGSVSGSGTLAGGIVGFNVSSGVVHRSYYACETSHTIDGGVVGCNEGIVQYCYYDSDKVSASGAIRVNKAMATNVSGLSTVQMTGNVASENMTGFEFGTVWFPTASYPSLQKPETTYTLTVINGTGGGEYAEGVRITITANEPEDGMAFVGWTGADGLTFTEGDASTATATFLMPAGDMTVTADFITQWSWLQQQLEEDGNTIVLDRDVVCVDQDEGPLTVPEDIYVTLDLNGHTVDRNLTEPTENGNVITVRGWLTLLDSSAGQTGVITGGNNLKDGGGVIVQAEEFSQDDNGSFIMYGGTVTGNAARDGGGVSVGYWDLDNMEFFEGYFEMYDGVITGNLAATEEQYYGYGGGVYVSEGQFCLYGGEISENHSDGYGGGVFVCFASSAPFVVSGAPVVKDNTWGDVPETDNVAIERSVDSCVIYIEDGLEPEASIGVNVYTYEDYQTMEKIPCLEPFTSGLTNGGDASNFVSDFEGYSVTLNEDGEAMLAVLYNVIIDDNIENGMVSASPAAAIEGEFVTLTITPDADYVLDVLTVTDTNGGPVTVTENTFTMPASDVTVTATFKEATPGKHTVTVNNGAGSGSFAEGESVTITANDPEVGMVFARWKGADGLTFTEGDASTSTATFLMPASNVTVTAVFIRQWTWLQQKLNEDGNEIILDRDILCINQDEGPLVVPEGCSITLDLNGHTIDRNLKETVKDGNVITVFGELTLLDSSTEKTGVITGGKNTGDGGGVYVLGEDADEGHFIMEGGTIAGNIGRSGGGVALGFFDMDTHGLFTGDFEMHGGVITGNLATTDDENDTGTGGGVNVYYGQFYMDGGEISENHADDSGGGVYAVFYINSDPITVSGAPVVKDNTRGTGVLPETDNVAIEYYANRSTIIIDEDGLDADASIGVNVYTVANYATMEKTPILKPFTKGLTNGGSASNFVSDFAGYTVTLNEDGEAMLAKLPKFASHSLVLDGRIGVNFFMDLPAIDGVDYTESYMTFEISGAGEVSSDPVPFNENNTNAKSTYYGFTCYVTPIQMADTITATFHYGDGQSVSETYSIEQYIESFESVQENFDEKTVNLVHALADYGHYVQAFLDDVKEWSLGTGDDQYAPMDPVYTTEYDLDAVAAAVEGYEIVRDNNSADIQKITYSVRLDSDTAILVFFKPVKNYGGSFTVSLDGDPYTATKQSDGRYVVEIPNIGAHLLGTTYTIVAETDQGDAAVVVSALSYVKSMLDAYGGNLTAQNAACAIYAYCAAAAAYNQEN